MSEVAILRSMIHPNVLKFIDCFIDESQELCCVTEYVDGCDLSTLIRETREQGRVVESVVVVDLAVANV